MGSGPDLSNKAVTHVINGHVEYIQFNHFNKHGDKLKHCFTTRKGGVGTGEFSTLNLGRGGSDPAENVRENYRRACSAIGVNSDNLVFAKQVHGCNIKVVGRHDSGRDAGEAGDWDGLATNETGVPLVTLYADCVPIFLFDPVKKVIALVHSGWRGTAGRIGAAAVKLLTDRFGSKPGDILAGIGPSIGVCCFEVDGDTAGIFREAFGEAGDIVHEAGRGKYSVDLWEANALILAGSGVNPSNIEIARICTSCNSDMFFSYRKDRGRTGRNAAIAQLV